MHHRLPASQGQPRWNESFHYGLQTWDLVAICLRSFVLSPLARSPSTALLTGRYQQRIPGLECALGTGNVGRYDDAFALAEKGELGLPPKETVLIPLLNQAGYKTVGLGKWHLGCQLGGTQEEHVRNPRQRRLRFGCRTLSDRSSEAIWRSLPDQKALRESVVAENQVSPHVVFRPGYTSLAADTTKQDLNIAINIAADTLINDRIRQGNMYLLLHVEDS